MVLKVVTEHVSAWGVQWGLIDPVSPAPQVHGCLRAPGWPRVEGEGNSFSRCVVLAPVLLIVLEKLPLLGLHLPQYPLGSSGAGDHFPLHSLQGRSAGSVCRVAKTCQGIPLHPESPALRCGSQSEES